MPKICSLKVHKKKKIPKDVVGGREPLMCQMSGIEKHTAEREQPLTRADRKGRNTDETTQNRDAETGMDGWWC